MKKDIILYTENLQKHFGLDAGFFAKKTSKSMR